MLVRVTPDVGSAIKTRTTFQNKKQFARVFENKIQQQGSK